MKGIFCVNCKAFEKKKSHQFQRQEIDHKGTPYTYFCLWQSLISAVSPENDFNLAVVNSSFEHITVMDILTACALKENICPH